MQAPLSLLSVLVDRMTQTEVEERCSAMLLEESPTGAHIVTINPEFIIAAQKDARFRTILNAAHIHLADGFGLLCASIFLLRKKLFRTTGVQACWILAKLCSKFGKKLYLLGAQNGAAQKTAGVFQDKFSGISVVADEGIIDLHDHDTACLPGTDPEWELACKTIQIQAPDVLMVALGAPKQEFWIAEHLKHLPSVRIAIGVGGSFDYISGAVPYAPLWMRRIGLEWLYRLIKQPQRIYRIFTATVRFPLAVFFWRFKAQLSTLKAKG